MRGQEQDFVTPAIKLILLIDKKLDDKAVNILYLILNAVIVLICMFNIVKFSIA